MVDSGLKPVDILRMLRKNKEDPLESTLATINTISAAKQRVKNESLQSLSPLVQLKDNLTDSNYTTQVKTNLEGTLNGLFFCHTNSLKLLQMYHTILFLDSTYKTNQYKMPLLHIAGVSGNNKLFSMAFCFLVEENIEFYTWALEFFFTWLYQFTTSLHRKS